MVSAASMSRSTSPAPTEGSWSTSPTSSRCAPGGTALISLLARIRSSMLASSTTIRSASSGWSRSKLGSPPGRSCSSRCTVVAGCPDSSVNRFAARPVGAASTIFARFAAASVITDLTVNDLPQPGPPVSTATRCGQRQPHRLLLLGGQLRPGPGRAATPTPCPSPPRAKAGIRSAGVVDSRSRAAASAVSARWNGTRYTAGIVPPSDCSGWGPVRGSPPRRRRARPGRRGPDRRAPRGSARRR